MDDHDLMLAFHAHTQGQTKFTRRMAVTLADMADMPVRSLVLRLERMGLAKQGSWDWFRYNGGISKEQIAEIRADNYAAQ